MAEFKREGYNLYYTDTDSIYIPYELPKNLISDKILGKFKLEYIFKDIVFLAPKVYAGITINNEYICKIKGYKNPNLIPFNDFKKLLNINEKLKIYHTKWFKSLSESKIILKNELYELSKTDCKRKFIYKDNVAIDTLAYKSKSNGNFI